MQRERSSSLTRRAAALAEACADRIRTSLAPSSRTSAVGASSPVSGARQDAWTNECQRSTLPETRTAGGYPSTSVATSSSSGSRPPAAGASHRAASPGLGSRAAALACSIVRSVAPSVAPMPRSPSCDNIVITQVDSSTFSKEATVDMQESRQHSTAEEVSKHHTVGELPKEEPIPDEVIRTQAVVVAAPTPTRASRRAIETSEPPGVVSSPTSLSSPGGRSAVPRGGVEVLVDFGPRRSRAQPPPALQERLSQRAGGPPPKASTSGRGGRAGAQAAASPGSVTFSAALPKAVRGSADLEFGCASEMISTQPPAAGQERLSQGAAGSLSSARIDHSQPPDLVLVSPTNPASSSALSAAPRGGVEVVVDFGSQETRSQPPAGLQERLLRRGSLPKDNSSQPAWAASTSHNSETLSAAQQAAPRGGVEVIVDFRSEKTRVQPPSALEARLSQRTRGALANANGTAERPPVAPSHTAVVGRQAARAVGRLEDFLASTTPAKFLEDHVALSVDADHAASSNFSPLASSLTTPQIQSFFQRLRFLQPPEIQQLLTWRLAILHERNTGVPATASDINMLRRAEIAATETGKAPDVPLPMSKVAIAVEQALASSTSEQATCEDKEVIERLTTEISDLMAALKAPGLSAKASHDIRKLLGQRRAEKARAERAVRKGRCAKLEVQGGEEAVQAILESVVAAAPAVLSPRSAAAAAARRREGPVDHRADDGWTYASDVGIGSVAVPLPPGFETVGACETAGLVLAGLLHPDTLAAAGAAAVGCIGLASKSLWEVSLGGKDLQFVDTAWRCICKSLSVERALWCPELSAPVGADWRRVLFDQLWPARDKWEASNAADTSHAPRRLGQLGMRREEEARGRDFKIQVSVRFKPGEASTQGKLLVPLHQKLMLLRKNSKDATSICKRVPPEFLDALLGHVMFDPVRLPSSGQVCDRRVIEGEVRSSGGRDPFDGTHLRLEMLEPQDTLRERIEEFRAEQRQQATAGGEEHKIDEEQVRELLGELGTSLDPQLVELLIEADRLRAAGSRAVRAAVKKREDTIDQEEEADEVEDTAYPNDPNVGGVNNVEDTGVAIPDVAPRRLDAQGNDVEEELGEAPRRDGPKLLAVLPPTRVAMFQPGAGVRPFLFSRVFDADASQDEVYRFGARSVIAAAMNGSNACLLVYGQTGSGKTHTMFGQSVASGGNAGAVVARGSGCVLRALRDLFGAAEDLEQACGVLSTFTAQYVQIYQDQVTCLRTGAAVALREDVAGAPVRLQGAVDVPVQNLGDASELLMQGEEKKRYAETAMNHRSSRAHTVLVVKINQQRGDLCVSSQLHLVDLAGSERVKKSRVQGHRFVEAVGINSSLMVLGQCIAARVEDRSHVPYYESRLTLLLRSALGGNSRTAAIICCHKGDEHGDETLQALGFGERCAMVRNSVYASRATSASEIVSSIDAALVECAKRIEGLESRGKGHLPACAKLRSQREALSMRRQSLAGAPVAAASS